MSKTKREHAWLPWQRLLALWAGAGLVGNFLWELLQRPLYAGYQGAVWHLGGCLSASAVDVAILMSLYAAMALSLREALWCRRLSVGRLLLLTTLGFAVAVAIEQWALARGRWSYGPKMPLVPLLGVGWVPVLQMVLIPVGLALMSRGLAADRAT